MGVKDNLVSWFIKNIEMSRMELIENPGFVVTQFSEKGANVFMREIFFPEEIFANIERNVESKMGERGAKLLYSAGKTFGRTYSKMSAFPKFEPGKEEEMQEFVYMFIRYMEAMWSGGIQHTLDLEKKTLEMKATDFVVCRKSGIGRIISEGTGAGFWEYIMDDPTIEGSHPKCIGRGADTCDMVYAPNYRLRDVGLNYPESESTDNVKIVTPEYVELNQIREPQFSRSSFKNMVDSGHIEYKNGVVKFADERHMLCEASIFYLVETALSKENGDRIVFQSAFDYGMRLAQKLDNGKVEPLISDYLSALGWGDSIVLNKDGKYRIISNYFPWTPLAGSVTFSMFRGMVSGILSGKAGRQVLLDKISMGTSQGFFVLEAYE
ncbi:MAG: hypothetical protein HY833_03495 [Candidatus Aenigmarchaeota archaeon]|nr:hypothetical protein [Candidatus Aenigmarchaeota archaeon]